jgi:hypothetical protein
MPGKSLPWVEIVGGSRMALDYPSRVEAPGEVARTLRPPEPIGCAAHHNQKIPPFFLLN